MEEPVLPLVWNAKPVWPGIVPHCCFTHPGDKFQIGPNLDLSKALNNGYRPLLLRIEGYPGHFGFLLIKIHILPIEFVTIRWIKSPKTQKKTVFF